MLYRSHAMQVIQQRGPHVTIEQVMAPIDDFAISPSDSLQHALQKLQMLGVGSLPVTQGDQVVGVLTQENIWELLMFRQQDPTYQSKTTNSAY